MKKERVQARTSYFFRASLFCLQSETKLWYSVLMATWTPSKIKTLRGRLELTQVKMGELLGVSETYVRMLEHGQRRPGRPLCFLLDRIKADAANVRGMSTGQLDRGRKK